ncbi:hypothetical protein [Ureibacillus massiliensis]|nr:hypothetical protein [Ureibacillus massiliensis]
MNVESVAPVTEMGVFLICIVNEKDYRQTQFFEFELQSIPIYFID